jgi:hypothetical protein
MREPSDDLHYGRSESLAADVAMPVSPGQRSGWSDGEDGDYAEASRQSRRYDLPPAAQAALDALDREAAEQRRGSLFDVPPRSDD